MGRGRCRGFAQSRMGPMCITKKALYCPRVLGKTGDFSLVMWMSFWVLDVPWVISRLLSRLSCLRQCCLRAADSLGAVLCPMDAMGCWESPQNPSLCGSTSAGKPGLCHTENLGPAPFAKAPPPQVRAVLVQLGTNQAPSSNSCLFPLCFH